MMFWRDIWLMGTSLLEVATKEISLVDFYKLVRDYWIAGQARLGLGHPSGSTSASHSGSLGTGFAY